MKGGGNMSSKSIDSLLEKIALHANCDIGEYRRVQELDDRRLYLYGEILPVDNDESICSDASLTSTLVEYILEFNRADEGIPSEERKPIRLYINSPGGSVTEGFALVSMIELSKTPIYTINVGQWSSMAFLIGIAGHRRFSLPASSFLMHDGSTFAFGSTSKAQDKMDFEKRFDQEIVKTHVLKHSNMRSSEYDALARVEYYLLPEDALERGFIDEIVTSIETIF